MTQPESGTAYGDQSGGGLLSGGPLRTTSTTDALVGELRRRILGGELRPGQALPELTVAQTFGVARPTVRSALQTLVDGRLLRRLPGRSATVPEMTLADMEDLFFVRLPLEQAVATTIAERGLPITAARRWLTEMESLASDASWGERVEVHTAFHVALVDAVGSPRLSRVYPALQEEMQLCLAQLRPSYPDPRRLTVQHRELVDAVTSGDPAKARSVMTEHLEGTLSAFAAQPTAE